MPTVLGGPAEETHTHKPFAPAGTRIVSRRCTKGEVSSAPVQPAVCPAARKTFSLTGSWLASMNRNEMLRSLEISRQLSSKPSSLNRIRSGACGEFADPKPKAIFLGVGDKRGRLPGRRGMGWPLTLSERISRSWSVLPAVRLSAAGHGLKPPRRQPRPKLAMRSMARIQLTSSAHTGGKRILPLASVERKEILNQGASPLSGIPAALASLIAFPNSHESLSRSQLCRYNAKPTCRSYGDCHCRIRSFGQDLRRGTTRTAILRGFRGREDHLARGI